MFRIKNVDISHEKLRLHSSERNRPWGHVFDEFKNNLLDTDIRYYPNINNVRERLRKYFNYEHLILGFGSDRCIKYFFEVNNKPHWFYGKKNLIITEPSFPMYKVYGNIFGLETIKIPYSGLNFPYKELKETINSQSIVILSNPSSPIGNVINRKFIEEILEMGIPVLIDEAYIEFSESDSCIDLLDIYDNLYICRSFSKAMGSAGMRIGVLLSQESNIVKANHYRDLYEISGLSVRWIETLLNNQSDITDYINDVIKNRGLVNQLLYETRIEHITSSCNWIHIRGDFNIPENIILKENCIIPGLGNNWIRLCITDDKAINSEDFFKK